MALDKRKADFAGWVTRYGTKCADGRTIIHGAFSKQDGAVVPLVWSHIHNDPGLVLGKCLLEDRPEGVYGYSFLNNSRKAQESKHLIEHGDINSYSIYANHLSEKVKNVMHGVIREVSLVLAPANPGAFIDVKSFAHEDDPDNDYEAVITTGEEIEFLSHSDEGPEEEPIEHSDTKKEEPMAAPEPKVENQQQANGGGQTVKEIFDTLTEDQKTVVYYMIGQALQDQKGGNAAAAAEHDAFYEDEENYMKHNVFEGDMYGGGSFLSHDDLNELFLASKNDAKNYGGSWKEAFIAHAEQDYGIKDIDELFPDYKSLNTPPEFIKREMDWVTKVNSGVKHVPFTRIKSMFADITADEARAKGYIKGKKKKTEVFTLLKRKTDPQTIYKLQKLDRDDILDITDFDIVPWLRKEMRMMLDEEKARAILIGDGREADDEQKISEAHIRPIATDAYLFTVKVPVEVPANATGATKAKAFINTVIRSRKKYKGSGSPDLYTTEDVLTECLLLEDGIGHKLYKSKEELATTLRVNSIITVEPMENHTITFETEDETTVSNKPLLGIIVNLDDYRIGADKGGDVDTFDDFDIDFNQYKYLIETRISGALVKPFSALAIYEETVGNGGNG